MVENRTIPRTKCVHEVPSNKLGIFAFHSRTNSPMTPDEHRSVIEGVLTAIQPKVAEALASPSDTSKDIAVALAETSRIYSQRRI